MLRKRLAEFGRRHAQRQEPSFRLFEFSPFPVQIVLRMFQILQGHGLGVVQVLRQFVVAFGQSQLGYLLDIGGVGGGDVGRIDDHQDVAGFDGLAEFYPHIQHRSLERG